MWGRPDYNIGNRSNRPAMKGVGWGGWDGEVQQVVGSADNDFTDFDEPVAYQVTGWKGVTLVPKLAKTSANSQPTAPAPTMAMALRVMVFLLLAPRPALLGLLPDLGLEELHGRAGLGLLVPGQVDAGLP